MMLLIGVLPALNFALANWALQLPVNAAGERRGAAAQVVDLRGYESDYFFTAPDGAMVLRAPVDGATTHKARYARSELREWTGDAPASWTLDEGGYLAVAMRVDAVPRRLDGGETRIVIGQIHGGDSQLVRLYYGAGSIHLVAGRNEARPHDLHLNLRDSNGNQPEIAMGEPFAYSFEATSEEVTVTVMADGATYRSAVPAGEGWEDNGFYFKAGLYLGADVTTATGWGQVSIYGLALAHDGTAPGLDWPAPPAPAGSVEVMASLNEVGQVELLDAAPPKAERELATLGPIGGWAALGGALALASVFWVRRRP